MSSELDQLNQLIQVGHDVTSHKYHAMAAATILFYDYLLTLADEIKYAWSGNKPWTFWLFLANRYFPMTYQFWLIGFSFPPQSELNTKICERSSWYSLFMFTLCTLFAQVVLTLRIYAVTMKNVPIALGFAGITAVQFALEIWSIALAASRGAQPFPAIPLDGYHLCVYYRHRYQEIACTSISLLYDSLAFSLVVYLAVRSGQNGRKIPTLLRTIAGDAAWYFLVIFSAHLTFVLTLNLARESLQLLPATGLVVYLPVMISRIMLSLRKAADKQQNGSSLPATSGIGAGLEFIQPPGASSVGEDDLPLHTYPGLRLEVLSVGAD